MTFVLHLGGLDPMLSATFVGSATTPSAAFATFSTKGVKHSRHGHAVTISGIQLKLTSAGEQILNGQNDAFTANEPIATASLKGTT